MGRQRESEEGWCNYTYATRDSYFLVLRSCSVSDFKVKYKVRTLNKAALAYPHSTPLPSFIYCAPGSCSLCFLCSRYNLPGIHMTRYIAWLARLPPLNLTSPSITAMIGNLMRKVGLLAICLLPDPGVFTVIFSRYSHHHGSLPTLLFWAQHLNITHNLSVISPTNLWNMSAIVLSSNIRYKVIQSRCNVVQWRDNRTNNPFSQAQDIDWQIIDGFRFQFSIQFPKVTLIWTPEITLCKGKVFLSEGESERGIKRRDREGSIKMQE